MRRISALAPAFVVAMVAIVVAAIPAEAAQKVGCRPPASKTVTASRQARVFRYRGAVYGCLFSRGVAVRMTTNDGYGEDFLRGPTPVLAGRFVGFTYYWEGSVDGYGNAVAVIDLRSGRENLTDFDATESDEPDSAKVKKLIVTENGWLAWSWVVNYKHRTATEIRKLAPGRSDVGLTAKPLDTGPDVDPLSLHRQGATIVWLHAYAQRTSNLS